MEVILFGIAREIVGSKMLTVKADENLQTVGDLKSWMKQQYPGLQHLTSLAVAVNSEYASDTQPIGLNSEVAIIPPVSGG